MVNTGTGEPTDEKAGDTTNKTRVEPKRWPHEGFSADETEKNDGGEESEGGDSGGHTESDAENKENNGADYRVGGEEERSGGCGGFGRFKMMNEVKIGNREE